MELFKLLGTIAVDNTKANNALDETADKAKDSSKETNEAFSKIGGAAKKIATGIGLINSAIGLANKLPGINVGKVKKLSLPRLYEGTVTEAGRPYLLEGTGAEAVVPLHNNRKWISAVANDLNKLQGNQGNYDDIMSRMNRIIELLETLLGMNIYLDSGVFVGELTPAIDARLGRIYSKTNRGNTR